MALEAYLNNVWYGDRAGHWLRPLGALYAWVASRRIEAYRRGRRSVYRAPAPVIVVGNFTVGGSGKTPLVIDIVERLQRLGQTPGIIARGYGSSATASNARRVTADSAATEVGDEPLLIFRRTGAAVAVCPDRRLACEQVLAQGATVIVADDGLQHLALARDLEIDVVDAVRGFGNERCLPAGPLRVPLSRFWATDLTVFNGLRDQEGMTLAVDQAHALGDGRDVALTTFAGRRVHAIAGIGHPARFFATLRQHEIDVVEHARADHASLRVEDLPNDDDLPILMTEKDAVKLAAVNRPEVYSVPATARLTAGVAAQLDGLLEQLDYPQSS